MLADATCATEGKSKKARATDLEWAFLMLAGVDVVEACLGSKSVGVDWQLP